MDEYVRYGHLTHDKFEEFIRPVEISQMIHVLSMPFVGILLGTLIIIGEFLSQNIKNEGTKI